MKTLRPLAAAAATVLLASTPACGGEDAPAGDSGSAEGLAGLEVTGEVGEEPTTTVDGFEVGEDVVSYVAVEGDGPAWEPGEFAVVHLYVANGTDGEKAFSSYDQGQAQLVKLDPQQFVGPEVAEELEGATQGSRVVLASSVPTLIGEEGAPNIGLPPEDDVVFVVDVLTVAVDPSGEEPEVPGDAPQVLTDDEGTVTGIDFSEAPAKPSGDLQVIPLVVGEGPEVTKGQDLVVRYYGAVYGKKKPFDESFTAEQPAKFQVGTGGLIKAWDQALVGLTQGSRVLLVVPPDLGYGEAGSPPTIPGGATLVFVVDILGSAG